MTAIKIFQLPVKHDAKFMNYDFVTKHNIMPSLSDYKLVYEGELAFNNRLDNLFAMLNEGTRPEGYKGHSLSVSDVVEMNNKYYFCDSWGWKQIIF